MRNALAVLAFVWLGSSTAWANKPLPEPERKSVGTAQAIDIAPQLRPARHSGEKRVWSERVHVEGATFLKLHLSGVKLRPGDQLILTNGHGREVERITGRGPKDRGSFWSLSAQGDTLDLRFEYSHDYAQTPFAIDRVIAGDRDLFGSKPADPAQRSICFPPDYEDAVCSSGDPAVWNNVRASVGVMTLGGNAASALWCSGSNISAGNTVLTNQHCIENQLDCDDAEFVFEHYRTECGNAGSDLSQWQSYRCDQVLAQEPFGSCDAGPGDLDFTLASVIGDPASTYGHAQVDPTPLASGEGLYIVQHPDGRPHEIASGDGADVVVDGSVLRYYNTLDTEPGSSGSPIFRASNHQLVGLHHCGGCDTAGVGNRGMLMSDIYPLISTHLCTEAADLRVGGAGALTEVAGNGDAALDPGEQWSFTIDILNNACSLPASGISALVSVSAGDAILAGNLVTVGDLPASTTGTSTAVVFTLPTDHVCGNAVSFSVDSLSNGQGDSFPGSSNVLTVTSGQQLQTDMFTETFDSGLGAWTIVDGGTGTGPAATWTLDNPGNRSLSLVAPYVIVDSDELGTADPMDEILTSPVIDASGFSQVFLRYTHDFNWYIGGQDEIGEVQVRSTATLGNWVTVASYQGGDSSGTVTLDITAHAAADLEVRFHYYNALYEWWWALDDIGVFALDPLACNVYGADADGDGVADDADNCTLIANADQRDTNGDGYGNACDADLNNDGVINPVDLGLFKSVFFTADPDADFNGDGAVNTVDLGIMKSSFFGAPGPSGVAP